MGWLDAIWRRFGGLPAFGAGLALYGGAMGVRLALGETDTAGWIGAALFAVFALYCVARPTDRFDAFAFALLPGPTGQLTHAVFGWSAEVVGLALVPVALALLWSLDRDGQTQEA